MPFSFLFLKPPFEDRKKREDDEHEAWTNQPTHVGYSLLVVRAKGIWKQSLKLLICVWYERYLLHIPESCWHASAPGKGKGLGLKGFVDLKFTTFYGLSKKSSLFSGNGTQARIAFRKGERSFGRLIISTKNILVLYSKLHAHGVHYRFLHSCKKRCITFFTQRLHHLFSQVTRPAIITGRAKTKEFTAKLSRNRIRRKKLVEFGCSPLMITKCTFCLITISCVIKLFSRWLWGGRNPRKGICWYNSSQLKILLVN